MADAAIYLYAITQDGGAAAATELTGVGGADVRTLAQSGLRAYVSTVPLAQFGEDALHRNLEDLAWLERTASAHHEVVDAVARTLPTAPVRLVTVYRDDEHVRRLLADRAGEFTSVLARISGRNEWGVKVYAVPDGGADRERVTTGGDAGGRPGTAYLKRRQSSVRSREDAGRRALSRAQHIDAALSAIAVASRRLRPQDPQLSGRDDWMVLNGAYLVAEERGNEFSATAESLREANVDVQVTGPWAPYSFAVLESEPEPGAAYDG